MPSKPIVTVNLPRSSIRCRALPPQSDLLRAFPRIWCFSLARGIAAAVGTVLLTAVEVTHAAEVATPQIQIETTVLEMPEPI